MGLAVERTGTPDSEARVDDESNAAFRPLYDKASEILRRWANSDLKDEMDAEEVAQDVCLLLFEEWEKNRLAFEDQEYLEKWLGKKLRGRVNNFLRAKRRRTRRDTRYAAPDRPEPVWSDPVHAARVERIERAQAEAYANLSHQRRECFRMKYQLGMKRVDIAAKLKISVKTVDHHIAFASRAIQDAARPHTEDLA